MDTVKSLLNCLKQSPLWFVAPSIVLALGVGLTISGYSPLMFDPSLYQTQSALAAELKSVDASAVESKGSKALSSDLGAEKLKDGEYTGYAPCGEGNPDGWKPYYVAVTITVKDGKVVSVSDIGGSSTGNDGDATLNWDAAENQKYLDRAVSGVQPQMESQIAESGSVSGIDTVSGATYSSVAIYNAYANAIAKAGGKAQAVSAPAASGSSGATQKLAGQQVAATGLADGDWTSYAACGKGNGDGWKPYYVAVTVRVKDGKVVSVTQVSGSSKGEKGSASLSWDASENQKYLSWAVDGRNGNAGVKSQINSQLSSKGAVSGVDTVSGATYSSTAIYEAYVSAVNKAAKAGGGKATKAKKTTKKKSSKKKKKSNKKKTKVTVSDDMSKQALADGTWVGYADCGVGNEDEWKPYYVSVTVKVSGGKVVSVGSPAGSSTGDSGSAKLNWDASENGSYLDWAAGGRTRSGKTYTGVIAQIQAAIASGGLPKSIDVVSGATYSSQSLLQAFYAALKKSAAKAGSTIEEPDKPSGGGDEPGGSGESPDPGGSDEPGGSGESPDPGGSDEPGGSGESPDPGGSDEPGGEDETPRMVDGTYTGYAFCQDEGNPSAWMPYYIIVNLEVADGKISKIAEVYGDTEGVIDPDYKYSAGQNKTYLDRAIKGGGRHPGVVTQINNALASGTVPTTCDTISAATYSSLSIIQAYNMALAEAQATATTS